MLDLTRICRLWVVYGHCNVVGRALMPGIQVASSDIYWSVSLFLSSTVIRTNVTCQSQICEHTSLGCCLQLVTITYVVRVFFLVLFLFYTFFLYWTYWQLQCLLHALQYTLCSFRLLCASVFHDNHTIKPIIAFTWF